MASKAFGQHKAVPSSKAVAGAIGVYHAATAFHDVAKLDVSGAVRTECTCRGLPHTAAEIAVLCAEAFQGLVGGVAADGAAGLAWACVGKVLGFNANQGGQLGHGEWMEV